MFKVQVSTSTEQFSDRALLHPMTTEYNESCSNRTISLVWRRTASSRRPVARSLPKLQKFAHWGLEITTPDATDGYVWELRLDPENLDGGDLLASAAPLDRWRGSDVGRASTGMTVDLRDAQIQTLAMSVAASMRRPMLGGSSVEAFYGEYENNCQKFARSLAVGLVRDVEVQKQMKAFFARQSSFGEKHRDPAIAPGEGDSWINSDAY